MGAWEGCAWDEIDAQFPGEMARRRKNHWNYVPPNGESYAMLDARIGAWLDAVRVDHPLVVVAHGGVGRVMRGRYAGLPPHEAVTLDQPQDAFHVLSGGEVTRISVDD